jgi:DNA-binding SARP family transcriptional activator
VPTVARTEERDRLADPNVLELELLGGFALRRGGEPAELPLSAQRVLAFVALHDRPILRLYVAGSLWPASSDARAAASLRTSVWRLHDSRGQGPIDASGRHLSLISGVSVDVRETRDITRRVLSAKEDAVDSRSVERLVYAADLLPDWYDDWALIEREQLREQRVRALECLCDQLTGAGRFAEAAEAGQAAVSCDPLRETAHRALIRLHIAEGNPGEALRRYNEYRRLLARKLGLLPSHHMEDLVAGIAGQPAPVTSRRRGRT